MSEKEIRQLIKQGESQNIELKSSLSLKNKVGETISAFANTEGGTVLIGISDKKEILGVNIGKKTIEDLANFLKWNTDPEIYPDVKVRQVNGKDIVKIIVKEKDEKPVFFKDRVFQRVGKTNQRISASKIRELAQQQRTKLYWDERICERANLEDIDEDKVNWFLQKATVERSLKFSSDVSVREALERLELARNGRLTNAAVLLFAQNPQKFFLQAETRCGRFKGTRATKPFIDMKVFGGNIIDQVEAAEKFVLRHTSMAVWVEEDKIEREEKWEYPPEAIREAIVNAICHRDYEISSNVQVRIFDDRIEFWGCGSLLNPLTVEDLKKKHRSILRNPLIGKCFFLIKFIEQWGTGTNDIIDMCIDWELPEPLFEEISGGLVVTLRKYHLPQNLDELNLNKRQREAIEFIKERNSLTLKDFKKICPDVVERTLRRDLTTLVNLGLIDAIGKKKGRKYFLR